jgi:hypothetical protein
LRLKTERTSGYYFENAYSKHNTISAQSHRHMCSDCEKSEPGLEPQFRTLDPSCELSTPQSNIRELILHTKVVVKRQRKDVELTKLPVVQYVKAVT